MTTIVLLGVGITAVNGAWIVVFWRMQRAWKHEMQVVRWALEKAINDQMNGLHSGRRRSSLWYVEQARKQLESEAGDET